MNTNNARPGLRRKDEGASDPSNADLQKLHDTVTKGLEDVRERVKKQTDTVEAELRKHGELSEQTKKTVDELLTKGNELASRLQELEREIAEGKSGNKGDAVVQSFGEQLVSAEKFKASQFASSGVSQGQTLTVSVKAPMVSTDVTQGQPGVMNPQILPGMIQAPKQRLFIRDLIAPGTTDSNAVSYVRMTGFTNNARVMSSEGLTKPYSSITFDTQMAMVATIAHMFKASKQILDDFKQLQSTVDAEMRYGLKFVEEQEILFGDGVGAHLHGIVPQASAYSPAFVPDNVQGIDELRLALLQAQLALYPATGIVLHPTAWAQIELTKTTDGAYIFANPLALAGPVLWGLPVVPTMAMDPEEFLVGAFAMGAQVFDREQMNVVIATQNVDDFEKNLISIRCEERLALAVYRPEAFIHGSFGSTGSSSGS